MTERRTVTTLPPVSAGDERPVGDPVKSSVLSTMRFPSELRRSGCADAVRYAVCHDSTPHGRASAGGIERRQELSEVVLGWLAVAEEALLLENEGKERAAVEVWRELFGWRMPRP